MMMSLLGKTIGQYQLIELVSQSNESLVFKGFQPARNRYAAVKMLLPSFTIMGSTRVCST
jgi:hypothetical protein